MLFDEIKQVKDNLSEVIDEIQRNYKKVIEITMTISLVIYLITLNFSKLAIYFEHPNLFRYEKLLRYGCYLLWIIVIMFNMRTKQRINYTNITLLSSAFLIFAITKERRFLLLVLFMLAHKEYDIKKMIKINMMVIIVAIMSTLLFTGLGVYPNWIVARSATEVRYCLGYAYATFLPAEYLAVVISVCFIYREKLPYKIILLMQGINMIFYYYTDSRTSFALTTILLSYIAVRKVGKSMELPMALVCIVKKTSHWVPIILLVLSLTLPTAYSDGNVVALNLDKALSGRLHYSSMALDTYEINYFGTTIDWVGNGGSDFIEEIKGEYNYVDNGYLRNLFDAGIVLTLIFLIAFSLILYKSRNDLDVVVVISIVLIWLFIEPHMLKIEMNILLMMMIPPVIRDGELDKLFQKSYHKIGRYSNEILHK